MILVSRCPITHLECLVQVRNEVAVLERHVCTSEVGVLEGLLSCSRHAVPVADPVGASLGVGELKLMVGREAGKVFNLHVVASSVGVGGPLVGAMTGCSGAEDARVRICRVVEPDNDALPIVTVSASNVAGDRLVLGEVPGVHYGEPSPVPGGTGVDLSLVGITTSSARIAAILETTTMGNVSQCSN